MAREKGDPLLCWLAVGVHASPSLSLVGRRATLAPERFTLCHWQTQPHSSALGPAAFHPSSLGSLCPSLSVLSVRVSGRVGAVPVSLAPGMMPGTPCALLKKLKNDCASSPHEVGRSGTFFCECAQINLILGGVVSQSIV